ncbi:MAG: anaerobic ribonucleoside-triphosphate reductase activating protein [Tenericutes bacterium]|nr:MAG: anaerobic ribonucleoside-triphosphate reductase activating protein [Mycoplasmatota bacterium]
MKSLIIEKLLSLVQKRNSKMHIAAFQPVSLNEYPGQISAIVFTQGCDFRCSYCHNKELQPLLRQSDREYGELLQEDSILEDLLSLKNKVTAVTITGGEPLLWSDIGIFIGKVKSMGFLIKLNTNGSNFYRMKQLIEDGLIDYINLDIKGPPEKYKSIAGDNIDIDGVIKSVEYLKSSDVDHIFTTVWDEDLLTDNDRKYIMKWVGNSQYLTREKI